MDRSEIKKRLPHRDHMLLLDEVDLINDEARGKYTVVGDEWFLKGHFPENPIVPGVILCEILAQSACVLLQAEALQGKTAYYAGLDKVRFKKPVRPGDTIETKCRIVRSAHPYYFAEGEGQTGGALCVTAKFSFALMD